MQERRIKRGTRRLGDLCEGARVKYKAQKARTSITGRIVWLTIGGVVVQGEDGRLYTWSPELDVRVLL
jgi:hypothetical protein